MATTCLGHEQRVGRANKISKLLTSPQESPPINLKVLIKKGPVSVETSLKELDDNYASKPEWKMIEDGGVLGVPVEEFRMMNPPQPGNFGRAIAMVIFADDICSICWHYWLILRMRNTARHHF